MQQRQNIEILRTLAKLFWVMAAKQSFYAEENELSDDKMKII